MKKHEAKPDISWKKTIYSLLEKEIKTHAGQPMKIKNKQRPPVAHVRDLLEDLPHLLKDLGIMRCIEAVITNLYLMAPRPDDPCKEINELLEEAFGGSSYAKAERGILEREKHKQLLLEYRTRQEIGKLKSLCHLLLPEEYGPQGELLKKADEETAPGTAGEATAPGTAVATAPVTAAASGPQEEFIKELEEEVPVLVQPEEEIPFANFDIESKKGRRRKSKTSSKTNVRGKKTIKKPNFAKK